MNLMLDHVSLQTPDLEATSALLHERLGLLTTRTPAAPDRHGRVYLDRSYLEVAAGPEQILPYFFLRFEHLGSTLAALAARGLQARATLYEGMDGVWEDVQIEAGPEVLLPFLIRRISPPEVAADWPPAQITPQPCGAEGLAAVHLRLPQLEPVLEIYERLLGAPELASGSATFQVGSGRIVLHGAGDRSPALVGLQLRVASLEHTRRCLSELGTTTWRASNALWTDLPGGGRLGFCEARNATDCRTRPVASGPARQRRVAPADGELPLLRGG